LAKRLARGEVAQAVAGIAHQRHADSHVDCAGDIEAVALGDTAKVTFHVGDREALELHEAAEQFAVERP